MAILTDETLTGDFSAAQSRPCGLCDDAMQERLGRAEYEARAHDVMHGRAMIAEALSSGTVGRADAARTWYFVDSEAGDWGKAVGDARIYAAAIEYRNERLRAMLVRVNALPLLAVALAHVGKFAEAHAEIDKTPGDCIACETARGDIDAAVKNAGGAQFWYGRAVHDAPSIPFAPAEWGATLLRAGQYEAATAQFKLAHDKGPHFADPLEMWGEALMQKNRSDLALPKFEEAAKYAPNWGRLHLEWGEALYFAGKKDDAKKQFAIAASLDLSQAEKAELMKWMSRRE
jgi:tetratricopeptide (TPR) repeat protein